MSLGPQAGSSHHPGTQAGKMLTHIIVHLLEHGRLPRAGEQRPVLAVDVRALRGRHACACLLRACACAYVPFGPGNCGRLRGTW
eukprot:363490-Chlamydomonas_euryale.AAC.9